MGGRSVKLRIRSSAFKIMKNVNSKIKMKKKCEKKKKKKKKKYVKHKETT